jgi:RNA-directed DNA polymerase
MSREVHVRICEGAGVRFPRATRLVVLHNTWEGIQRCKEAIQEWLKGMGLELKDTKTRFAHTLEAKEECNGNVGFNFLGFTIRQFPVGKSKSKK